MKKIHYIYGIISVVLVLLGVNFKIQHWPGAGIMITLGIAFLLLVFLPIALVNNYRHEGNRRNLVLYIVAYLTALVVMAGALFKIQHWPGAGSLIIIALPFPFVVFLPVYLYVTSKIENFELNKTVFVLLLLAYVSVFSALLAINVSRDVLHETLMMATTLNKMQPALKESVAASMNKQTDLQSSGSELVSLLASCREKIYQETGTSKEELRQGLSGVRMPDSQSAAQKVLLFPEGKSPALQLKQAMEKFKASLSATNPSPALKNLANTLLNTSDYDTDGNLVDWETLTFNSRHLSWILSYLESLENSVYMLEMQATSK
jgi:hypothetical protein